MGKKGLSPIFIFVYILSNMCTLAEGLNHNDRTTISATNGSIQCLMFCLNHYYDTGNMYWLGMNRYVDGPISYSLVRTIFKKINKHVREPFFLMLPPVARYAPPTGTLPPPLPLPSSSTSSSSTPFSSSSSSSTTLFFLSLPPSSYSSSFSSFLILPPLPPLNLPLLLLRLQNISTYRCTLYKYQPVCYVLICTDVPHTDWYIPVWLKTNTGPVPIWVRCMKLLLLVLSQAYKKISNNCHPG